MQEAKALGRPILLDVVSKLCREVLVQVLRIGADDVAAVFNQRGRDKGPAPMGIALGLFRQ